MTAFLAFRLKDNATRFQRYEALLAVIESISSTERWTLPTSFIALTLTKHPVLAAQEIKAAIDPTTDVALLYIVGGSSGIIIGGADNSALERMLPGLTAL